MCFAQKLSFGSLEDVFAHKTLNVAFDFSRTSIDGIKESALLNIGGERGSEGKREKENICAKFVYALHSEVEDVIEVGFYPGTEYTLIFIPYSFDGDGEVIGKVKIVNKEGEVVAIIEKVNGDGGNWDSFCSLPKFKAYYFSINFFSCDHSSSFLL